MLFCPSVVDHVSLLVFGSFEVIHSARSLVIESCFALCRKLLSYFHGATPILTLVKQLMSRANEAALTAQSVQRRAFFSLSAVSRACQTGNGHSAQMVRIILTRTEVVIIIATPIIATVDFFLHQ